MLSCGKAEEGRPARRTTWNFLPVMRVWQEIHDAIKSVSRDKIYTFPMNLLLLCGAPEHGPVCRILGGQGPLEFNSVLLRPKCMCF